MFEKLSEKFLNRIEKLAGTRAMRTIRAEFGGAVFTMPNGYPMLIQRIEEIAGANVVRTIRSEFAGTTVYVPMQGQKE